MSNTVQRRMPPGTPWWLPVLLALAIILIVGGLVFGNRIKNAFSSPTATPTVRPTPRPSPTARVVTATPVPGAANATPTPGGPTLTPTPTGGNAGSTTGGAATATPGPGGSTPLPRSTPIPTIAGLENVRLGEITRPQSKVTTIQAGADQKNPRYTYYLNPYQVVQKNLPFYGFTGGFQITSPASPSPSPTPYTTADGRPAAQFYVNYRNHAFTIRCVQPGKTGPTGIWMIVTILPGKQPPA